MQGKIIGKTKEEFKLSQYTLRACMLSKGRILGVYWGIKLKPTSHVMGGVELTKR